MNPSTAESDAGPSGSATERIFPPPATPPPRAANRALPTLPGLEILGVLGRGGMGVVYKARQSGLGRTVAVKMIIGGPFADPESKSRFRAEAEAVAKLQHPNIVQVFAVGAEASALGDGFAAPYLVQEYMDGGTLEALLTGVPYPPPDAARLVETLARAMHYAHEHGIIHRDLKPANILLRRIGEPPDRFPVPLALFEAKVGDFGLAKQIDSVGGPRTVSGAAMGTPEYMAPEQALDSKKAGPGADVYALGVILYQLVTGNRPFVGATPIETLALVVAQEPVSLRRLQPGIPRDLETIALKCLRKQPHKRYTSAHALAEDLARFLRGEPIAARPVGLVERARLWAARRPAVAALTLAVAVVAAGGVAGITAAWLHALSGWGEADRNRIAADGRQVQAEQARADADRRRDEAETHLYFSRVAQARLEARTGNTTSAAQLLDLCLPAGEGALDRRGWEWHHLKGVLNADLLGVPAAHEFSLLDLAFSPDGRHLASAGGSPFRPIRADAVRVWDVWGPDAGRPVREFPHPRMILAMAYLDGGRQLGWSGADGTVKASDAETGQVLWSRELPPRHRPPVFSPDGRWYASTDSGGQVHAWDAATGTKVFTARSGGQQAELGFGPDGLLAVNLRGAVRVWNVADGRDVASIPHANGGRGRPAFSPDGRRLAQGTTEGQVQVWELASGRLVFTLAGHTGGVLAVAFGPDGRHIATAGADRTVRLWSARTGVEELLFRGHDGRAVSLAFHPSGRYLASGGQQPGDLKVWDLTRHQEYVRVPRPQDHGAAPQALGFAADGSVLVARTGGWVNRVHPDTGADLGSKPVDLTHKWLVPASLAAFSADGGRLASVVKEDTRFVTLHDLTDGSRPHRLEHPFEVVGVASSRDGRRVATTAVAWRDDGQREVRVWDADTGRPLTTVRCEPLKTGGIYGVVALSPDGRLVAHDEHATKEDGTPAIRVVVRDVETGEVRHKLEDLTARVAGLTFDRDARLLAVSTDRDGVVVYDCREDRWRHRTALHGSREDSYVDPVFSPDGRRLAAVSREQVLFWDAATGQMIFALRGGPPRPSDNGFNPRVAWSPDGRRLVATNWDLSVSIWDAGERHTPAAKAALHAAAEGRALRP